MKRLTITFLALLCSSLAVHAKLRLINIKSLLKSAGMIREITVIAYNDSLMSYKIVGSDGLLYVNCKVRQYSESERLMSIRKKILPKTHMAGKWPETGQKVLLVTDTSTRVTLFATRAGSYYRFWDPTSIIFANSAFSIPKEDSYKPLADCGGWSQHPDSDYLLCSDGCLVNVAEVHER